ncbi:MAG: RIP metalloprotease RseP [Bacillota bacterium]|nr:RIP metalloprotease RseP [Bacillota bacterium]MDW7682540.1 RIP metalloprotease RseP [Bacillota bacterium]
MLTLLASIAIFALLIFFHELGHFLVAKRAGIGVIEFAIGFGPRLTSFQSGETVYSIRAFPLGGFVRLVGEDPEESDEEGSFQQHSVWSRFATIAAGPIMNFILAILLFSLIYFAFLGVPLLDSTQIGEILPEGPAAEAGMMAEDEIISIAGQEVQDWSELVSIIHAHPEQEIDIRFERDGEIRSVSVVPERDPATGEGRIGIQSQTKLYAPFASLRLGVAHTAWFLRFIAVSIVQMLSGQVTPDVVGPVGIIQIVGEVARSGVVMDLLSLAAIISLNLGFLNLLPIPALDGSRLMFLAIEGVRGRPVDPQKESFIHFVGFTVLILLMILIAYRDLVRLNIFN